RQLLRLFGMQVGFDRRWVDQAAGPWLERLSMSAAADRKIRDYSKGMTQRIGLIQALMYEPEVVFLDEPTDGVDPVGRAAIRTLVSEVASNGTTVFINSHLLMEVEMICDDIVILKDGSILRQGTLADLTPSTDGVDLHVRADQPVVLELLEGLVRELIPTLLAEPGLTRLHLRADDDELNAVIDRLRDSQIPIVQARRDRKTLEQVFIELVGEDKA
ncbi:MAG: ABC transporter ATP-binding protein, partial [Planctomycetes bacterium]|nr:ABC transporter ATP-binding protein [Planctomycetota bacterium]